MQEIERAPLFSQNEAVNTIDNVSKIRKNPLLNNRAAVNFGLLSSDNEDDEKSWLKVAISAIVPQGFEIPEPASLFSIGDIPVLTLGELSLLIARPKQGKSTVASWIAGQMITEGYKVLVIDTEMGTYYSSRNQHWLLKVAGLSTSDSLTYLDLKKYSSNERIHAIEAYLESYGHDYDLCVIDGIRDLVNDINSNEETSVVTNLLMKWAVIYNIHILNILHKNKTSNDARGALGSELMNKCETTLDVALEGEQIVVTPLYTRNESFAPFAFTRDSYGVPQLVEGYVMPVTDGRKPSIKWGDISDDQHNRILMDVFKGGLKPKLSDLRTRLSSLYGTAFNTEFSERKIKALIDYLMNDISLIKKEGVDRSPNSCYYLAGET